MKKIYFAILFALSLSVGFAQTKNVSINNLHVDCYFRSIPFKPLSSPYFCYSTAINANGVTLKNISVSEIKRALVIEGQQKSDNSENAAVIFELAIDNINIRSSNIFDRVKEEKRNGKVEQSHYYSVRVIYSFSSSYAIKTADGKVLLKSVIYGNDDEFTRALPEYLTAKEATNYWENNREKLIAELYMDFSMKSANAASSSASFNFGFQVAKKNDHIKVTNEKKHVENQKFKNSCTLLKNVMEYMTPEIPLHVATIDTVITYYENIPKRYFNKSSKADAHLRYAAYFNLCKIYFWMDDPDKASEYADLLIANDIKKKDGEHLKKEIEELRKTLNRLNIKTRHFDPDKYFEIDCK